MFLSMTSGFLQSGFCNILTSQYETAEKTSFFKSRCLMSDHVLSEPQGVFPHILVGPWTDSLLCLFAKQPHD